MDQPNIIIINTHDSGRYLGCYGFDVPTPSLDLLADKGIRFENYFCTAPQCSPSRASLLTGLYPHRNGMMGLAHLGWRISDVPTLPQVLKESGYDTLLFGIQHESSSEEVLHLGYDTHEHLAKFARANEVTPEFLSFLKSRVQQGNDKPFFASVGFWETHRPFDTADYVPSSISKVDVPYFLEDNLLVREDLADFCGMMKAVDYWVGEIYKTLLELDLINNTMIIFTTDHGMAFPRAKGTLYDSGTAISLLISWPGRFRCGRVVNQLCANIDLMPTLLEVAGVVSLPKVDGQSLLPLCEGVSSPVEQYRFSEITWHDRYCPSRAIRSSRYKYIKHFNERGSRYLPLDIHKSLSGISMRQQYYARPLVWEELYDLTLDPYERNNLISNPEYNDVRMDLSLRLSNWMKETRDPILEGHVGGKEHPLWTNEKIKGTVD